MVKEKENERKQCPACAREIKVKLDGRKITEAVLEAIRDKSADST